MPVDVAPQRNGNPLSPKYLKSEFATQIHETIYHLLLISGHCETNVVWDAFAKAALALDLGLCGSYSAHFVLRARAKRYVHAACEVRRDLAREVDRKMRIKCNSGKSQGWGEKKMPHFCPPAAYCDHGNDARAGDKLFAQWAECSFLVHCAQRICAVYSHAWEFRRFPIFREDATDAIEAVVEATSMLKSIELSDARSRMDVIYELRDGEKLLRAADAKLPSVWKERLSSSGVLPRSASFPLRNASPAADSLPIEA